MSIKITNISKYFNNRVILKDINVLIPPGQCYCILGKNGAGKSTLINILLDLIKPDNGKILISDMSYDNNSIKIKKNIGALPESSPLIPEFTGYQYLKFIGLLHKLRIEVIKFRINRLNEYFFEFSKDLNKRISTYSHGMKVKLGLCSALIHKPRILILDEPFAGLDPLTANKLINFLIEFMNSKRTIFLSSHNLLYVEKIATHIGILDNGYLKYSSSLSDFIKNGQLILEQELLKILKTKYSNVSDTSWIL